MKRVDIYRLPGIDPVTAGLLRHSGHATVSDLAGVEDVQGLARVTHVEAERLAQLRKAARDMELESEIFGDPEEARALPGSEADAGPFAGFLKAAARRRQMEQDGEASPQVQAREGASRP